ncbi:YfcC family protein [Natranaerobius thermophilus]|uniref:C4-dicarboxylate anaerobic carrier n=1 Tax=Natranaerobius thermophilus (strain ATCC BAA-1301 / DSM 18059 / JW/NM-WN-LF) TaxID=457570 RepID=B2A2B7_NATTJ|nr:TIGR00366 family protein [Natranaerobius thermophilus]ACB86223.1 C4-dicarboxylate anaerobic carrier [Natranaerobius thermophilus JW/NM-WN-LF]
MKKIPHVYVLIFCIIIFSAIATYIVPAGNFEREVVDGTEMVVPGSYETVESTPVGLFGILKAIPNGMIEMGLIIFFIFIVGGAFSILKGTGAIDAAIGTVAKKVQGKEGLLIPVLMTVFALLAASMGLLEEFLPFIVPIVMLCLALGFDSITGVAIVMVGAGSGFAAAFANPFTLGVAQGIADVPMFSGMAFRIPLFILVLTVSILYVYRYASKIKENPELSPVYEIDQKRGEDERISLDDLESLTLNHKLVLATMLLGFMILLYGVIQQGWYIVEIAALFLGMGIVGGLIGKIKPDDIAEYFIDGAKAMVMGALVVGLARGILEVLTAGQIIDTILFALSNAVEGLPGVFAAMGMFVFQTFLNILVPSGGGQAALTMPIMAPLSDLIDVSRQTAVLAYQLGDGFTNMITPTLGPLLAALALAGVSWEKYAKWILPLIGILSVIGLGAVTLAHMIQLGPI